MLKNINIFTVFWVIFAMFACTERVGTDAAAPPTSGTTSSTGSSSGGAGSTTETASTPPATTPTVSGKIIDNEDKTAGLKGIDANGNGIRDDIDRLIALKYAGTPEIKKAAEQEARALQRSMEATTRVEALRAGDAIKRAARCTDKLLPLDTPEQIRYWESMSKDIVALTANTKERFTAYWNGEKLKGGAVFQQPSEPVCD